MSKEKKAAAAAAAASDTSAGSTKKEKKGIAGWFKNECSKFSRGKFLLLLMIPGVAFYAIFQYWPFYGLLAAFKDYQPRLGILGSPWADNYGFAEFIRFFTIPDVWNYVWNTIVLSVLHIIWLFPLAIILALFINELRGAKFKKIVQTVSYLPHFVSVAAVAGMLTLFLSSQQTPVGAGSLANEGIINQFLLKLHLVKEGIPFLQRTEWFRTVYIASDVWQSIGWSAIIYIAALSAVDQELYEAAVIDGAGRWNQMLHVTLPGITPTIVILLVMRIGQLLSVGYEKIILLYNPTVYETADVISTYVYRRALLEGGNYGYSAAVGMFNSIINFVLLITANRISKRISGGGLW